MNRGSFLGELATAAALQSVGPHGSISANLSASIRENSVFSAAVSVLSAVAVPTVQRARRSHASRSVTSDDVCVTSAMTFSYDILVGPITPITPERLPA